MSYDYAEGMPVEFNNESKRPESSVPKANSGPAISFSQDKALSNTGKASTVSWILILMVLFPGVGVLIGIFQIQEARASASRGKPWSAAHTQSLYFATIVGLLFTIGFGLLLV
jgi:hypothetical protein